ncbi:hypothetical protein [Gemmatimonas aurantiaca]|uniref:hypothetical protein n=1 Tax=Gemmatimonas aurantiaca TaxID=173480 RepID=UPI00301B8195
MSTSSPKPPWLSRPPTRDAAEVFAALQQLQALESKGFTPREVAGALLQVKVGESIPRREVAIVGRALGRLFAAGKVDRAASDAGYRYRTADHTERGAVPARAVASCVSRRQAVLMLLFEAFERCGRPVRLEDVLEQATWTSTPWPLIASELSKDLTSLLRGHHIRLAATLRGQHGGARLFVPAGAHESTDEVPRLTVQEVALRAFQRQWVRHLTEAFHEGRAVYAVTTGEVHAEVEPLEGTHDPPTRLAVIAALRSLERSTRPIIKRLELDDPQDPVWIPAAFDPTLVDRDLSAATSRLRVQAAVRRAIEHIGSAAVSFPDLDDEVALDPHLAVGGPDAIRRRVESLVRDTFSVPGVGKSARVRPILVALGVVAGRYYFTLNEEREGGEATIALLELQEQLASARVRKYIDELRLSQNAGIRDARVSALRQYFRDRRRDVTRLAGARGLRTRGEHLVSTLREVLDQAESDLAASTRSDGEADAGRDASEASAPLWTAAEVCVAYRRVVANARCDGTPTTTAKLLGGDLLRVHNPDFTHQTAKTAINAERTLYDRADVLMSLAVGHGGPVVHDLGRAAKRELGLLRDVKPVLEAAMSPVASERRLAVSALAFLQDGEGLRLMQACLEHDPDPGTRMAALCGLGLAGEDISSAIARMARNDASGPLRAWAARAVSSLRFEPRGIWAL